MSRSGAAACATARDRSGPASFTTVGQVLERAEARPRSRLGLDGTITDLDNRLDRQERAQQGCRRPDPPTLADIFQRVEGTEDPDAGDHGPSRGLYGVKVVVACRDPGRF